jgi:NAD(P)-dependent dehydrogenase (short-subunit alcohol dehydrogenase family)
MTARTCLVTGAGRGIGGVIAARLSAAGHRVALNARGRDGLESVAGTLPGPSLVVPGDVTDPAAADEVFGAVEREWGPVEVLVLNAGTGFSAPLARTTDEDWQHMLDLNLTAPFRFLRRAAPTMAERGWGRVVVIASVAAKQGAPYISAYAAAKHGVLGLVRSAAAELAGTGVTVNAICPGYLNTAMVQAVPKEVLEKSILPLIPVNRLGEPEEIARAVVFLAADEASGITGSTMTINGGQYMV